MSFIDINSGFFFVCIRYKMSSSSKQVVKRNFKITESSIGYVGGKYTTNKSGSPLSAAQRAASVLFRMAHNKDSKAAWKKFENEGSIIKFTIRETTNGFEKKDFQYEAKAQKLRGDAVKVVKRGDVEYEVTQKITVRAAHYTPFKGGADEE